MFFMHKKDKMPFGLQLPFLIWTDHKNPLLHTVRKETEVHQARWALLFSWFDFTLISP